MQSIIKNRGFRQRFTAWLACVSMLIGAIAPTVTHALSSQTLPSGMMKVCTSTGNKFIPVSFIIAKANTTIAEPTPATSTRSVKADKMHACGYCDQHAGSNVVIQYANHLVIDVTNTTKLETAYYINPRSYFLSTPTSPRGPPIART